MISLNPRLLTVAGMADPSLKTVDVGTDHAYLPVYMHKVLGFRNIIGCDIGSKPLENARKTLDFYKLNESIELRLSNGLRNISPDEAQQITICGMGGTLIRDILSAADWIKRDDMRLILQPMTHSEDVRKYLCENGFTITDEKCVDDTGRVYCCIAAVYTGHTDCFEKGYYYFGDMLNKLGASEVYVKKQITRLKTRLDAIIKIGKYPDEQNELIEVIGYYERNHNDQSN